MNEAWNDCPNCGSTLATTVLKCDRCGATTGNPESGRPRFKLETREAAQNMGGLLVLYHADGEHVRYVAWCPAGSIGIDEAGAVVWMVDWGYMGQVTVDNGDLRLDGRLADIETGKLK